MRIGFDARLYKEAGVGRYIRNLLFYLQKLDQKNEYFIFLLDKDFDDVNFSSNFQKVRANFRWYGFKEQLKFPRLLDKYKLDLVHFPHFNVPILYRGKFVVTIHDLIHQRVTMQRATTRGPFIYKLKQFGYKRAFSFAIKKSQKIFTVSDYVREQLEDEWGCKREKIAVTKEAVEESLVSEAEKITKNQVKKVFDKFSIRTDFIFYVGNAHPHKNVEGLIKAFLEIKKIRQDLQLVLSGSGHYFWDRIKQEYADEKIIFTGYISDEELVALYKGANVYVVSSFEEGFGIPLLEAFACGCPVVSSNAASLPEVGGDAAVYFDPKNQDEMVLEILRVLNDNDLRKELITKGKRRVKMFSWEKLAKETLEVYKIQLDNN